MNLRKKLYSIGASIVTSIGIVGLTLISIVLPILGLVIYIASIIAIVWVVDLVFDLGFIDWILHSLFIEDK